MVGGAAPLSGDSVPARPQHTDRCDPQGETLSLAACVPSAAVFHSALPCDPSFSRRTHSDQFLVTFKEVGRKPPTFGDASVIALELLNSGYEFDEGSIIFNRFRQEYCCDPSFCCVCDRIFN